MTVVVGESWLSKSLKDVWKWLTSRIAPRDAKKTEAEKAATAAEAAKNYSIMSAPGLEAETSLITDRLETMKAVADPNVDLSYAKKLTGQLEPEPVPGPPGPVVPEADKDEIHGLRALAYEPGRQVPKPVPESGADPEAAAAELAGRATSGMVALALGHTPGIIAEAASLGQVEAVLWTTQDLLNASGLPDVVKRANLLPIEIGLFEAARYHYNAVYLPRQPDLPDLPRLLARRQISELEYLRLSRRQGLDDRWAAGFWNAFLQLPAWQDLRVMLWRGLVDDAGFKDVMLRQGWHPDVVDEMLNLAWQIPGPADLIRFVVREVITPDAFIEQMYKQGYGAGWAGAYWDAHFVLPAYGDLVDAFHRGVLTDAELRKFIFWHDYQPTARPGISKSDVEILRGLTKTLIPRVDLRRAWAQGELTDAQLEVRYELLGFEDDSALLARIQRTIALTAERSGLARQYLAALRKGLRTESEVRTRLAELKLPKEAIELLILTEQTRREIGAVDPDEEPRILTRSDVLAAYKRRLFPRDVAQLILTLQGWPADAVDVLLALNEPDPQVDKPISEVRTAAAAVYRDGYMDPNEFDGLLRASNHTTTDIAWIRMAEDLRARLDLVKEQQAMVVDGFRKDVFTEDELRALLLDLGMLPDRVDVLVARELFRKLPKPKVTPG